MKAREKMGRHIEIDLREVGYEGETCLEVARDRFQWQAFVFSSVEPSCSISKIRLQTPISSPTWQVKANIFAF
jgi:hypothetical protein